MIRSALSVPTLDTLSFVGLERSHLRSAVYRRVFGDTDGPVRIGRYSILERIGSGARGVVFKAFDNQLDRLVALKVLSTRADDHAELFREAKALARLSHPNVLAVYEVGETDEGQVFLATEYVKGWTLRSWYDEEHRSESAIVDVLRQVAAGVQAAHDEGLVHRDLKPANILLGQDGRVRVADFGLARFDPSALEPDTNVPRDGLATTTAGTPGYMAPELFAGSPASAASDQYALAVTLHELLYGETPGPGTALRGHVGRAIQRGLADAPEDRFASVEAFRDALSRRKSSGRRALVAGAILAVAAGASAALYFGSPGSPEPGNDEVVLLKAQAALPENPAAALDALRGASNLDDPRLLSVAERAISLGPTDTRFTLPTDGGAARLFGSLLVFRDGSDALSARRVSPTGFEAVATESLGLVDTSRNKFVMFGWRGRHLEATLDDLATLHRADAWAARSLDEQEAYLSLSLDGLRIARIDPVQQRVTVSATDTGESLWTYTRDDGYLNSVRLDETGRRVALTLSSGEAWVHDLDADASYPLEPLAAEVYFEADEDHVIIQGRFTGTLQRVRLSDERAVRLVHDDGVLHKVQLSPDRTWVAAASSDARVYVTKPNSAAPRELEGSDFAFSPDNRYIAVQDDQYIRVHDLTSWDVHTVSVPAEIKGIDFDPDGSLWSLARDRVVRHHRVPTSFVLAGHGAPLEDVVLSHDGGTAVSVGDDYKVRVWDVDTGVGRVLADVDWDSHWVALDEGGGRVALPKTNDSTYFVDLATGEPLGEAPNVRGRPVVGPKGALVGAGKDGVWSNLDGVTTILRRDDCHRFAANESMIAAICGEDDDWALHVWAEGQHDVLENIPDGGSLHVWPSPDRLLYMGLRAESHAFQVVHGHVARVAPTFEWNVESLIPRSVTSRNHDLVLGLDTGVHTVWPGTTHASQVVEGGSRFARRPVAVSGDGTRIAYTFDEHRIIVRERSLSNTQRDLASVLEAHTVTEGSL